MNQIVLNVNIPKFLVKSKIYSKLCFYSCVHFKDQYQLHLGEYSGNAGNALSDVPGPPSAGHKWTNPGLRSGGVKFSTYDQLNDADTENNDARCIRHSKSGWWFSR